MRSLAFLARGNRSKPLNCHRAGLAFATSLLWQNVVFKISGEIIRDFQEKGARLATLAAFAWPVTSACSVQVHRLAYFDRGLITVYPIEVGMRPERIGVVLPFHPRASGEDASLKGSRNGRFGDVCVMPAVEQRSSKIDQFSRVRDHGTASLRWFDLQAGSISSFTVSYRRGCLDQPVYRPLNLIGRMVNLCHLLHDPPAQHSQACGPMAINARMAVREVERFKNHRHARERQSRSFVPARSTVTLVILTAASIAIILAGTLGWLP
ncbi:MAG: hypothetical protein EOR60_09580 [Mesorhizobium sp.]|nr:MAG: hypothetical protein EOR60_09580 [Mesorhizobium sp.]